MTALETPAVEAWPLRRDEHGVIRVGRTRVSLDTVVTEWLQGATPEQIIQDYDTLSLADINAVIAYYLSHRGEVDAYLEESRRLADEARRRDEERCPPDGIRERLLARRAQEG